MSKPLNLLNKKSAFYNNVFRHKEVISGGVVLVIDPSIGSTSSAPGWAIYSAGSLYESGVINTGGAHTELWQRARKLGNALSHICVAYQPDLVIYEDIPATSGFNQNAIASLLKAVGVVISCTSSEYVFGVHPASWRGYVREGYKKGDEEDAIEIGHICVSLAALITQSTRDNVSNRGSKTGRGNMRGNSRSGKGDKD